MTIWTGEIVDSLSMGGYFRERLSYDDGLHIHAVIARDLRSIIGSAFLQAEPPAPCDEPPSGRDRNGLGGDSPAGAVGVAEAPSEITNLKAENNRLSAALAESERKRGEASAEAAEAIAQRDILIRANADLAAGWVEDATPTQETPHVES
ncbi:hypothetical protein [Methylobacterium aquaticum]|uniref:Uncharacterized protein n=1 Tax=Methylobacterium aquaticum TaxID=270351 RepID=A0A0C6EVD3_9HYPH|nr:hypothetical protein [Methylobacterium aquaticum]BAQ44011.1 hypothetical protein Maq22A_c02765 [Methylobacterium aquaticum]